MRAFSVGGSRSRQSASGSCWGGGDEVAYDGFHRITNPFRLASVKATNASRSAARLSSQRMTALASGHGRARRSRLPTVGRCGGSGSSLLKPRGGSVVRRDTGIALQPPAIGIVTSPPFANCTSVVRKPFEAPLRKRSGGFDHLRRSLQVPHPFVQIRKSVRLTPARHRQYVGVPDGDHDLEGGLDNATEVRVPVPVDAGPTCWRVSLLRELRFAVGCRAAGAPGIDSPHAACGALGHRPIGDALELQER